MNSLILFSNIKSFIDKGISKSNLSSEEIGEIYTSLDKLKNLSDNDYITILSATYDAGGNGFFWLCRLYNCGFVIALQNNGANIKVCRNLIEVCRNLIEKFLTSATYQSQIITGLARASDDGRTALFFLALSTANVVGQPFSEVEIQACSKLLVSVLDFAQQNSLYQRQIIEGLAAAATSGEIGFYHFFQAFLRAVGLYKAEVTHKAAMAPLAKLIAWGQQNPELQCLIIKALCQRAPEGHNVIYTMFATLNVAASLVNKKTVTKDRLESYISLVWKFLGWIQPNTELQHLFIKALCQKDDKERTAIFWIANTISNIIKHKSSFKFGIHKICIPFLKWVSVLTKENTELQPLLIEAFTHRAKLNKNVISCLLVAIYHGVRRKVESNILSDIVAFLQQLLALARNNPVFKKLIMESLNQPDDEQFTPVYGLCYAYSTASTRKNDAYQVWEALLLEIVKLAQDSELQRLLVDGLSHSYAGSNGFNLICTSIRDFTQQSNYTKLKNSMSLLSKLLSWGQQNTELQRLIIEAVSQRDLLRGDSTNLSLYEILEPAHSELQLKIQTAVCKDLYLILHDFIKENVGIPGIAHISQQVLNPDNIYYLCVTLLNSIFEFESQTPIDCSEVAHSKVLVKLLNAAEGNSELQLLIINALDDDIENESGFSKLCETVSKLNKQQPVNRDLLNAYNGLLLKFLAWCNEPSLKESMRKALFWQAGSDSGISFLNEFAVKPFSRELSFFAPPIEASVSQDSERTAPFLKEEDWQILRCFFREYDAMKAKRQVNSISNIYSDITRSYYLTANPTYSDSEYVSSVQAELDDESIAIPSSPKNGLK